MLDIIGTGTMVNITTKDQRVLSGTVDSVFVVTEDKEVTSAILLKQGQDQTVVYVENIETIEKLESKRQSEPVASFTHELYQNDLTDDDPEYDTKKHQPYFEFAIDGKKCLIGLDKVLECMVIADKIKEIPVLGNGFWTSVSEKYGVDYYDYNINLIQD